MLHEPPICLDSIIADELITVLTHHHWIHDQRECKTLRALCDSFDNVSIPQSSSFGRDRLEIVQNRIDLINNEVRWHRFDTPNTHRVLRG